MRGMLPHLLLAHFTKPPLGFLCCWQPSVLGDRVPEHGDRPLQAVLPVSFPVHCALVAVSHPTMPRTLEDPVETGHLQNGNPRERAATTG